jgi:hypothetical protein
VIGMVRANRPGRALLGLSKLLVGAFGTAAFALTTNTIWQMGDALSALRLTVIIVLGIGSLIAWLIVAHDLWEKPGPGTPPELARLFNIGTVFTLRDHRGVLRGAVRRDGGRRMAPDPASRSDVPGRPEVTGQPDERKRQVDR